MKFIEDTEYIIMRDGVVINSITKLILKPHINSNGYWAIGIMKDRKQVTRRIHRLVAEAYLEKPFENATVNHIDGNKNNNDVSNLEWISLKDNIIHSYEIGLAARGEDRTQAILDDKSVEIIKLSFIKGVCARELAEIFSVGLTTIHDIRRGKTWTHIRPDLKWDVTTRSKLTAEDIPLIREAIDADMSDNEIGKLFGVHRTTIRHIRLGNTWTNY